MGFKVRAMRRPYMNALSVAMVLLFLMPLMVPVKGDGGVFSKYHDVVYLTEDTQYAVIYHEDGIQSTFVSIKFDQKGSNQSVWIYPVPSAPEEINVDLADGVPEFRGSDILKESRDYLDDSAVFFGMGYLTNYVLVAGMYMWAMDMSMSGGSGVGVHVHEHIENYGIVAEVISSTGGEGIYNYTSSHGLEISRGLIPELDYYVEKGCSFIVTWLNATNASSESVAREPAIIFDFPTEKMWYPMVLTSIYSNTVIPIKIVVPGLVTPELYDSIKPHTKVGYWEGFVGVWYSGYSSHEIQDFIERFNTEPLYFTTIEISAPASDFKKDLWIDNKAPDKIMTAKSIYETHGFSICYTTYYLLFATLSVILSIALGIVIIGREKKEIPYYISVGVANFTGIILMVLFVYVTARARKWDRAKVDTFVPSLILAYFISGLAYYSIFRMLVS